MGSIDIRYPETWNSMRHLRSAWVTRRSAVVYHLPSVLFGSPLESLRLINCADVLPYWFDVLIDTTCPFLSLILIVRLRKPKWLPTIFSFQINKKESYNPMILQCSSALVSWSFDKLNANSELCNSLVILNPVFFGQVKLTGYLLFS